METKKYIMEDALEAIIDYRGKTPKKSESGIPTLSAKSVKNGYIDYSECYYISKEEYLRFMVRGLPKAGDILLTTEAPLGMIARLDRDDVGIAQRLLTLRGKQGLLDNNYLLYYLQSPIGQHKLLERESGSTVTGIKQSEFRKIEIEIPNIETQKIIASYLSCIDNKIELNKKINRNLSDQCDAIFKESFIVNSDESWAMGTLSELITVMYGKDHKKLQDGEFPCYGSGGIMRFVERPIYDKESVLIPRKGTLNNVMYVSTPFWSVDTMFYTVMNIPNAAKFVYHFIKEKDLAAMNAGSAVPSMTTAILNAMELKIPSASALEKFEADVQPLYKAMDDNNKENKILSELRNTLLPKLMSGEINISELEI